MTEIATSLAPKQMKTITTLLNLVKSELFITIDHAERCLEMFISERQSNASLQQFIQALQQVRGTLTLIEISGGTELTELMLDKALSIPTAADKTWDQTLTILSTSLFTLRRYLENFETYPCSLPELLIPSINELRQTNKQPPLPDSYFTDINIDTPSLLHPLATATLADSELFGRLRQMYQIGLLGIIKDTNRDASLRMMTRSIDRLQKHIDNEDAARLCWVVSAALEAFIDSDMTAFPTRKRLFSRVDQQLRNTQVNHEPINQALLKDLLYMICLDNVLGIKALNVFGAFNLAPLPYNNKTLETEISKLAGPGQSAICSFTAAIREELEHTQTAIDSFTSSNHHKELIEALLVNLEHLIKTLSLVNLQNAETMLREQIGILEIHKQDTLLETSILDRLADVILHVEGIITNYETNAACDHNDKVAVDLDSEEDNSNQYLKQGRQLVIQESLVGFVTAQQNIVAYVESNGDKQYLEKLPQIIDEIYGCLLFLNQNRAAKIIHQCKYYITTEMINSASIPPTQQLDNLADVLASIEFFMETETLNRSITESKVLDLAEESLTALNVPDIPCLLDDYSPKITATAKPQQSPTMAVATETFTDKAPEALATASHAASASLNFDIASIIEPELLNNTPEMKPAEPKPTVTTSSGLQLEPLNPVTVDTEEKPQEPAQVALAQDDDDIHFTGPESWKLL